MGRDRVRVGRAAIAEGTASITQPQLRAALETVAAHNTTPNKPTLSNCHGEPHQRTDMPRQVTFWRLPASTHQSMRSS